MKAYVRLMIFFAIVLIAACKQKGNGTSDAADTADAPDLPDTTEVRAIPAEQLIKPGESIGKIRVGEALDSVILVLGKPDTGDAAMGSQLSTWYANHDTTGYQTSVFSHRNMGGKDENKSHIKKILVTSPWFKTAEYISTGNNMKDIGKYYKLKEGNSYKDKNEQTIKTYSDIARGISFEIDGAGECVSILVHQPNSTADTYLNMH
ncbi:hypothetical protein [Mucilaginibacter pedocola]|uniref:Intradiol ring-cleavage dioxygenases domain-containing protein n=1 Tax=Mucilaginibacter pedocola TaxID=1792845 RepID=A0A1S9PHP4_9SPHI|nr:hypothetical protein [Mucilaginibacter pedocola]OOQ60477.1 hypothetical protein BC343_24595 [Mucilaginibacter pedocola]